MPHFIVSGLLKKAFYNTLNENEGKLLVPNHNLPGRKNFLHDAAIVGAGIASLNAAYQLKRPGLKAPVYDAAHLTGGRMYTIKKEKK